MTARARSVLTPIVLFLLASGLTFGLLTALANAQGVDAGAPVADVAAETAPAAETPPAAMPDPAADPLATASLVVRLWKSGALVPAIVVALFALVVIASRYVSWLGQGKRAVYTAGAVAALALLAEPASRGTTPNLGMIVAAIGAFVALVFPPTKPKTA